MSLVRGKWQSTVTRFGLSLHLGLFDTAEEASLAYQKSKQMTHEEFAVLARSKRRANRLTLELTYLLRDFPGFTYEHARATSCMERETLACDHLTSLARRAVVFNEGDRDGNQQAKDK